MSLFVTSVTRPRALLSLARLLVSSFDGRPPPPRPSSSSSSFQPLMSHFSGLSDGLHVLEQLFFMWTRLYDPRHKTFERSSCFLALYACSSSSVVASPALSTTSPPPPLLPVSEDTLPSSSTLLGFIELRLQPADGYVPSPYPPLDRLYRSSDSLLRRYESSLRLPSPPSPLSSSSSSSSAAAAAAAAPVEPYLANLCVSHPHRSLGHGRSILRFALSTMSSSSSSPSASSVVVVPPFRPFVLPWWPSSVRPSPLSPRSAVVEEEGSGLRASCGEFVFLHVLASNVGARRLYDTVGFEPVAMEGREKDEDGKEVGTQTTGNTDATANAATIITAKGEYEKVLYMRLTL